MTKLQGSGENGSGTGVAVGSAGGAFVIVNNVVLLTATVLGACATLYADLFPRSSVGQQKTALALGWVACIVLSMLVLGYHDKASSGNPLKRIARGARVM